MVARVIAAEAGRAAIASACILINELNREQRFSHPEWQCTFQLSIGGYYPSRSRSAEGGVPWTFSQTAIRDQYRDVAKVAKKGGTIPELVINILHHIQRLGKHS